MATNRKASASLSRRLLKKTMMVLVLLISAVAVARARSVQSVGSELWNLDRIDETSLTLDGSYHYFQTGAGVNIYIIDGGVRVSHEEFSGRIHSVGDFCGSSDGEPTSGDVSDNSDGSQGHGTHNADIAAGATHGVAKGAEIWVLRVRCLDGGVEDTQASIDAATQAINWIVAHGPKPAVVNLSFAWTDHYRDDLYAAIDTATAAGYVFTLSGSCDGAGESWSSGVEAEALVVGSTNSSDEAAPENYGAGLALFAPAIELEAASKTADDAYWVDEDRLVCADSYAAPHVAGVIARFLQLHPKASPTTVTRVLINHATASVLSNVYSGVPNRLLYSGFLDDSPSSPSMSSSSGIRGCSNYSAEASVQEPDAASCLQHCLARGGDACEFDGSNCYVEFGDGCYVQGGIGGWSAAVLGPVDAPTAASMQTDNAVRGCSNYVELSPVSKGSAAACLSYCQDNYADACEWLSGNSQCYVEYGDACHLEGGHSGWYGAVLHALPAAQLTPGPRHSPQERRRLHSRRP